MGKSRIILHFSPIELYPPIQNLIRVLEHEISDEKILILTTSHNYGSLSIFLPQSPNITIKHMGHTGAGLGKISRTLNYLFFYTGCLWYLLLHRPKAVLYFETLSSFPAYVYKKLCNRKGLILAHYHEYISLAEYAQGMTMVKWFHQLEKKLYPELGWLSHTNQERLAYHLRDMKPQIVSNARVLPNYPPASWKSYREHTSKNVLRLVYVGALSMDTMHTEKMAQWVQSLNGTVKWDIFSYNYTTEAADYINGLESGHIRLLKGLNYEELPEVLKSYDVGLILYTGHITNYVYNAPNKLFEYLACGLDVWYPSEMLGCYAYNTNSHPKVVKLEFDSLSSYDPFALVGDPTLKSSPDSYTAETALAPLINLFLQ